MKFHSQHIISIYQESIQKWHEKLAPAVNPYPVGSLENLFFQKNQIDTIQWHEEDEIRRPDLPDSQLIAIKRKIDRLNQERTDLVEQIDDLIFNAFKQTQRHAEARMNSETPAWLVDRMSILELKIYHMEEQTQRTDVEEAHIQKCKTKLSVLLEQRQDMKQCFDELIEDIEKGVRYFKTYKQMKMYNDQNLNPALYQNLS